ncbi:MAG: Bor/Iss family lipoprotein [Rhodothermales bacterium]
MRNKIGSFMATALLLFVMLVTSGCSAHTHIIGDGGDGSETVEKRQWYVLWGLVPINDVDSAEMADGATDYTIETEQSALDVIINIFTSFVSVYSRTVTVTK